MSLITKLTTLGAAGAGGESGWIMELQDTSYPITLTGVDKLDSPNGANSGNIIVSGLQDSSGEDGVIMEIDVDGNIVSQRIQNNNNYTYYNTIWEDSPTGYIYTGGYIDAGGGVNQGITRFSNPTTIASASSSKAFDISGGSSTIVKPLNLSSGGVDYRAIVGVRSSNCAFMIVSEDLSTVLEPRYYNPADTNLLVGLSQNGSDIAMAVESSNGTTNFVDIYSVSPTSQSTSSWRKRFYISSTYYAKPVDNIGFNTLKFWYSLGYRGGCTFNTNKFNTSLECAGLITIDGGGTRIGEPIWTVNESGTYRQTSANGLTQDENSTSTYREIYVFGQVVGSSTTDALVTLHNGYNGSISRGLRIQNTDSGGYLDLNGIVSRSSDFFYVVGRVNQTSYSVQRGVIMKLPKDLLTTGTFGKYVLSTPTLSQSTANFTDNTISLPAGGFNTSTYTASNTLSSYSTSNTLTSL